MTTTPTTTSTTVTPRRRNRWAGRLLATAGAASALLLGAIGPAAAAGEWISVASATAVTVNLVGGSVTSGTAKASNDGTQSEAPQSVTPALAVSGSAPNVSAGVLTQQARAFVNGSSAACAGVVGTGGSISINSAGVCTVNAGSGGVVIEVPGVLRIKASAITAQCTADATGKVTASTSLADAAVYTFAPITGTQLKLLDLLSTPSPNSGLNVLALAKLGLNVQTSPDGAGSISANALEVTVLGSVVGIKVANVTCGPTKATPAIPAQGLPVAAGVLGAAGWALFRYRDVLLTSPHRGRVRA